jgi:hypothetical protein
MAAHEERAEYPCTPTMPVIRYNLERDKKWMN